MDRRVSGFLMGATLILAGWITWTLTTPTTGPPPAPQFELEPETGTNGLITEGLTPAPAPASTPAEMPDFAQVDLNAADAEALEELPGIGPVLASRIIAARSQGAFDSIEQVRDRVIGIGPVLAERLRPLVCFGPVPVAEDSR